MKLTTEARIALPPDEVFAALLDVERVAECLPNGVITGKTGPGRHTGELRVSFGRRAAVYTGTVRIAEIDHAARRIALIASGKEQSGLGEANASLTVRVSADGTGSTLSIETDLLLSGRITQFARGTLGEVSGRLVTEFARNVERLPAVHPPAPTAPEVPSPSPSPEPLPSPAPRRGPLLSVAAAAVGVALLGYGLRRRLGRQSAPTRD